MTSPINPAHSSQTRRAALYCFSCGLFGFVLSLSASADEVWHDPTRPPSILAAPQDRETVEMGPALQSITFASGRRTAMISGQHVEPGSRIGEARVVGIYETEVVLKTGNSLQTLKLFPDVEKHSVVKVIHYKHRSRQQKTKD